jgi:hypothetical protein
METKNEVSDIKSYNTNSYFIERTLKNKNVIYCKYHVSHDGYDKHGPKSNLYDYYIIVNENGDYIFYSFHKERWYTENDDEDFELWEMMPLSKLTKNDFNRFPKINLDYDIDLKKAYDKTKASLFSSTLSVSLP